MYIKQTEHLQAEIREVDVILTLSSSRPLSMGGSSSADKGRRPYQSIVVGSGPGGLATVCALLDQGVEKIAWVDSEWTGGRLNGMYREISS